jgi:hypothetical protein
VPYQLGQLSKGVVLFVYVAPAVLAYVRGSEFCDFFWQLPCRVGPAAPGKYRVFRVGPDAAVFAEGDDECAGGVFDFDEVGAVVAAGV